MKMRYSVVAALFVLLIASFSVPAVADTGFSATINAAQEVPTNSSTATGSAILVLNAAQTSLTISGSYSGLGSTRTAQHIHGPAAPGVNAGVLFPLTATGTTFGTISGTWALTATNVTQLLANLLYINIHTTTFGGGEIRGQILPDATPTKPSTWGRIKSLYR